jgi:hypothetical protein
MTWFRSLSECRMLAADRDRQELIREMTSATSV